MPPRRWCRRTSSPLTTAVTGRTRPGHPRALEGWIRSLGRRLAPTAGSLWTEKERVFPVMGRSYGRSISPGRRCRNRIHINSSFGRRRCPIASSMAQLGSVQIAFPLVSWPQTMQRSPPSGSRMPRHCSDSCKRFFRTEPPPRCFEWISSICSDRTIGAWAEALTIEQITNFYQFTSEEKKEFRMAGKNPFSCNSNSFHIVIRGVSFHASFSLPANWLRVRVHLD